jgi:hypothetical protein
MDDEQYYHDTNTTRAPSKPKVNFQHRKIWQGREDADMLLEKQLRWNATKENNSGIDDDQE